MNMYTSEDLEKMQSFSLERKIQIAQTRIIEFYTKLDGKVYISFSGGKDSTVLLDLARRIYPDIPAIYIDTGLEYPEIKEFVKTKSNVEIIRPELSFKEVIKEYGYPLISKHVAQCIWEYRRHPDGCRAKYFDDESEYNKKYKGKYSLARWTYLRDSNIPISHKCCDIMKKKPAKKYEKETGRRPLLGTMASESIERRTEWLKKGCNSFEGRRETSKPLSIWTEQNILEYLDRTKIPYCSVYGNIVKDQKGYYTTNLERTGCVYCTLGCHLEKQPNRFQKLKQIHPKLYEYCMKPLDEGGLGLKDVLDFIGVKYE